MNICMVGFYQYPIPPIRGGSLAVVAYELIKEFAKNKHNVSVFSIKDRMLPNYEENQRIHYFRSSNPVYPGNSMIKQSVSSLIYSLSTSIKINCVPSVDIIQCFDPLVLPLIKWFNFNKKRPVILRFGMGFGLSKGWQLMKRPNWAFIRLADQIIVPSHFLKNLVVANLGLSQEKVSVIPNGVNLQQFSPELRVDMIRRKYDLGDSPVILFVGRIYPEKGVDLLIESIPLVQKRVKDVKLLIVGPVTNEIYMKQLRSIISKLGLRNVIFTGAIDVKEELPEIYAACTLFCCPSVHGEGFGNVALEALASGKPVVTTRSGGLPEIIEDGKVGYVVPVMKKKELAQALIRILEDADLQKTMGREARKRAEELFSWGMVANEYLRLFEEVSERN